MESDEEFCLKWNNHHNTLVSVFDTLLKSGTLVDCTIAAGGQYLKAHRVVLSACSPFFELLLSQHGEQHPIVILKDVTFTELQTMIDYMYRGEVNVSQDQLGPLLKAARSLQIKGLSDSGRRGGATTETPEIQATPHTPGEATEQQTPAPVNTTEEDVQPLPRRLSTREGSTSPVPRKRRKHRHKSSGGEEEGGEVSTLQDGHDQTSNSSERSQPVPNTTLSIPAAVSPTPTLVQFTEDEDCKPVNIHAFPEQTSLSQPAILPDQETAEAEVLLEPKSEYVEEEVNEGSVEDLTLDNDENEILSMDHAQPGPSHTEEGPNEGYGPWRFGDDITMSTQETIGAYRDAQAELCQTRTSGVADGRPVAVANGESTVTVHGVPDNVAGQGVTQGNCPFQDFNSEQVDATARPFNIPLLPDFVPSSLKGRSIFPTTPEQKQVPQITARLVSQIAMQEFKFVLPQSLTEAGQPGSAENSNGQSSTQPANLQNQGARDGPEVVMHGLSSVKHEAPDLRVDVAMQAPGSVNPCGVPADGVAVTGGIATDQLWNESKREGMTLVSHLVAPDVADAEDVKPAVQDLVPLLPQENCSSPEARRVKLEPDCKGRGSNKEVAREPESLVNASDGLSTPRAEASRQVGEPAHWSTWITGVGQRPGSLLVEDNTRTQQLEEYRDESAWRSLPCTPVTKSSREYRQDPERGSARDGVSTPREPLQSPSHRPFWSVPVCAATERRSDLQRSSSMEVIGSTDASSQQSKKRKASNSESPSDRRGTPAQSTDMNKWLHCPQCKKRFMSDFNLYTHVQFFCQPNRRKYK